MKTAEPRYLNTITRKHRRLSRMQVFYTGSINCKAGDVQCPEHYFNGALHIKEFELPVVTPIIRDRQSGHRDAQSFTLPRTRAVGTGHEDAADLEQLHIARALVEVVLHSVEEARDKRRSHLRLIDVNRIQQRRRRSIRGPKKPIALAAHKAEGVRFIEAQPRQSAPHVAAPSVSGKILPCPAPRRQRHVNQVVTDVPRDFFDKILFPRNIYSKRRGFSSQGLFVRVNLDLELQRSQNIGRLFDRGLQSGESFYARLSQRHRVATDARGVHIDRAFQNSSAPDLRNQFGNAIRGANLSVEIDAARESVRSFGVHSENTRSVSNRR